MNKELRVERRGNKLTRCPYCHDDIERPDEAEKCAQCDAVHHASCAVESGSCGTCRRPFELEGVVVSQRQCAFFHDCGARAVAGDSLCHNHRLAIINADRGRTDTRSVQQSIDFLSSLRATLSRLENFLVVSSVLLFAAGVGICGAFDLSVFFYVNSAVLGGLIFWLSGKVSVAVRRLRDAQSSMEELSNERSQRQLGLSIKLNPSDRGGAGA